MTIENRQASEHFSMTETCSFCGNTTPAGFNKPLHKITAIEGLAALNVELMGQLTILCDWLEKEAHKFCKCENNGDLCDFHSMLYDAKEALK